MAVRIGGGVVCAMMVMMMVVVMLKMLLLMWTQMARMRASRPSSLFLKHALVLEWSPHWMRVEEGRFVEYVEYVRCAEKLLENIQWATEVSATTAHAAESVEAERHEVEVRMSVALLFGATAAVWR